MTAHCGRSDVAVHRLMSDDIKRPHDEPAGWQCRGVGIASFDPSEAVWRRRCFGFEQPAAVTSPGAAASQSARTTVEGSDNQQQLHQNVYCVGSMEFFSNGGGRQLDDGDGELHPVQCKGIRLEIMYEPFMSEDAAAGELEDNRTTLEKSRQRLHWAGNAFYAVSLQGWRLWHRAYFNAANARPTDWCTHGRNSKVLVERSCRFWANGCTALYRVSKRRMTTWWTGLSSKNGPQQSPGPQPPPDMPLP